MLVLGVSLKNLKCPYLSNDGSNAEDEVAEKWAKGWSKDVSSF